MLFIVKPGGGVGTFSRNISAPSALGCNFGQQPIRRPLNKQHYCHIDEGASPIFCVQVCPFLSNSTVPT
jgi:hypothetical protein